MDALLRESVVNGKTVNIGRHFVRIVFCFLNLFYSCYSKEACIFKRALPVDTSHPLNKFLTLKLPVFL